MTSRKAEVYVQYLCRERMMGTLVAECNKRRSKIGDDPGILFWRALGLGFTGKIAGALEDFEALRNKRDYALGAVYGLLYFSQRQSRCSSSEIESLRLAAEMTAETSSDVALLNAANILLYLDQPHDAKGVLNRMSASSRRVAGSNACSLKASNLRGWLELASGEGRQGSATSAERHFAASLGEAPSDVDAMLGLAACYSMRNDWSGALAVLNQAIAATTFGDASSSSSSSSSSISSLSSSDGGGGRYSEGVPCLVEKARMLANCGDWAQAEVTAQRVLDEQDRGNVCALRLLALHAATRIPSSAFAHAADESSLSTAILGESPESRGITRVSRINAQSHYATNPQGRDRSPTRMGDSEDNMLRVPFKMQLELLVKAMDRYESRNVPLFLATARLFSRVSLEHRHPGTLSVVVTMLNKALTAFSQDATLQSSDESEKNTSNEDMSALLCELAHVQTLMDKPPSSRLFSSATGGGGAARGISGGSAEGGLGRAMETYRKACSMDPANLGALYGMIDCQLLEDSDDDALQQLELLKALSGPDGTDAQLLFLEAKIAFRQRHQASSSSSSSYASSSLHLLHKAVAAHTSNIVEASAPATAGSPFDGGSLPAVRRHADGMLCYKERWFIVKHPGLLLDMAALYLAQCSDLAIPTDPLPSSFGSDAIDASYFFESSSGAVDAGLGAGSSIGKLGGGEGGIRLGGNRSSRNAKSTLATFNGSEQLLTASGGFADAKDGRGGGGGVFRSAAGRRGTGLGRSAVSSAVTSDAPTLRRALQLLRLVSEDLVPADVDALLLAGRATLLLDPAHPEDALAVLKRCLEMDMTYAPAHLLVATVALDYCEPVNLRLAQQSLDQALSFDFSVRSMPKYHIVRARLLGKQGLADEALSQLQLATEIEARKRESRGALTGSGGTSAFDLEDRAAVSIETIKALVSLRRFSEAKTAAREAKREFRGTPFEVSVVLCESSLLVANGDADGALRLLGSLTHERGPSSGSGGGTTPFGEGHDSSIPSSSSSSSSSSSRMLDSKTYWQVQRTKASIYLFERRDKAAYTRCVFEVVEHAEQEYANAKNLAAQDASAVGSARRALHEAYKEFGEAMLEIQAPMRAVEAFRKALEVDPSNAFLAVRIGRALIATHDYQGAHQYYEAALCSPYLSVEDGMDLRHDLAKLLIKLRKYRPAVKILHDGLAAKEGDAPSSGSAMSIAGNSGPASPGSVRGAARGIGGFEDKGAKRRGVITLLLLADVYSEAGPDFDARNKQSYNNSSQVEEAKGGDHFVPVTPPLGETFNDGDDDEEDFDDPRDSRTRKQQVQGGVSATLGTRGGGDNGASAVSMLVQTLTQAKNLQAALVAQVKSEGVAAEGELLRLGRAFADICCRIAAVHCSSSVRVTASSSQLSESEKVRFADERDKSMAALFHEALKADGMHEGALLGLAELLFKSGDLDAAEEKCQMARRVGGALTEDAVMLLTNISMARAQHSSSPSSSSSSVPEYQRAAEMLKELLRGQPRHYDALARLMMLYRNAGTPAELAAARPLLNSAEATTPRAFADAGLNYCKGLFYFRLQHDPHQALHYLNKARRDGEWGPAVLLLMITIYVEPTLESIFYEQMVPKDDDQAGSGSKKKGKGSPERGSRGGHSHMYEVNDDESVSIAEALFAELKVFAGSDVQALESGTDGRSQVKMLSVRSSGQGKVRLTPTEGGTTPSAALSQSVFATAAPPRAAGAGDGMLGPTAPCLRILKAELMLARAFVMKSSKQGGKSGADALLDEVAESQVAILEEDRDCVPAMLVLSAMFTLQAHDTKSRNMLKRIAKMPHAYESGASFEHAYLVLAGFYIAKKKYDLAQDLCKRCLQYNKSCAKAHEVLGSVHELELAYKDAAESYEHAWSLTHQGSPSLGYQLGFNYLKAKRFIEAIGVAHDVIKRFPNYPKIRQDILEVAMRSLKP